MLLSGRLFDTDGLLMEPAFGHVKKRRYSYYASKPMPRGALEEASDDAIRRVPADAIDQLVTSWAERLFPDGRDAAERDWVRQLVGRVEIHPSSAQLVIRTPGCRARQVCAPPWTWSDDGHSLTRTCYLTRAIAASFACCCR